MISILAAEERIAVLVRQKLELRGLRIKAGEETAFKKPGIERGQYGLSRTGEVG